LLLPSLPRKNQVPTAQFPSVPLRLVGTVTQSWLLATKRAKTATKEAISLPKIATALAMLPLNELQLLPLHPTQHPMMTLTHHRSLLSNDESWQ
jgi:hypothetical protein